MDLFGQKIVMERGQNVYEAKEEVLIKETDKQQ